MRMGAGLGWILSWWFRRLVRQNRFRFRLFAWLHTPESIVGNRHKVEWVWSWGRLLDLQSRIFFWFWRRDNWRKSRKLRFSRRTIRMDTRRFLGCFQWWFRHFPEEGHTQRRSWSRAHRRFRGRIWLCRIVFFLVLASRCNLGRSENLSLFLFPFLKMRGGKNTSFMETN